MQDCGPRYPSCTLCGLERMERQSTTLAKVLLASKGAFIGVGLFSAVGNILMLTGPLFMLQVYDRVLSSRSSATLVALFAIVAFLFALMGQLDHYRGRVLARIGAGFQSALDGQVFDAVLRQAEHPTLRERPAGGLRDFASIQTTLASPRIGAVFDLPWTPLFVLVLFLFHPCLGWCAMVGGEPPRVYRRLVGSNVRLLFQWRSRLHKTSPLRLAA